MLAVTTLLATVACKTTNGKTWLDRYLCIQHEYGEGVVKSESTCLREGVIVYACKNCGEEKTEKVIKKSHTPYTVAAKESTCGTSGYTQHTACAVCGTVIEGKELRPKLQCTHENDVYYSMGTFVCSICGDERMEYQEYPLQARYFQLGAIYRFYLPAEGSEALITFRRTDAEQEASWGEIKTKEGAYVPVASFSIGFKRIGGEVLGPIWYGGSGLYYVDVTMREGIDYVDIYIGAETMKGFRAGNEDEEIEITLQKDKLDLSERGFAIATTNGAKIVRLDGVTEKELLG